VLAPVNKVTVPQKYNKIFQVMTTSAGSGGMNPGRNILAHSPELSSKVGFLLPLLDALHCSLLGGWAR